MAHQLWFKITATGCISVWLQNINSAVETHRPMSPHIHLLASIKMGKMADLWINVFHDIAMSLICFAVRIAPLWELAFNLFISKYASSVSIEKLIQISNIIVCLQPAMCKHLVKMDKSSNLWCRLKNISVLKQCSCSARCCSTSNFLQKSAVPLRLFSIEINLPSSAGKQAWRRAIGSV